MGEPGKCHNHPRRKADVVDKRGNAPMVDLCWECYDRAYGPEVIPTGGGEDHVEGAGA